MRTGGASDNKNEEGVGRSLVFQVVAQRGSCDSIAAPAINVV
jgi:hypothetical protein